MWNLYLGKLDYVTPIKKPLNYESQKINLALHAGYDPEGSQNTQAVPIYQTTSYVFKDTDHAANLFSLAESGYIYTRLNNPTNDVLEQRLAALEGGAAAVVTASGTAAIATTLMVLLKTETTSLPPTVLWRHLQPVGQHPASIWNYNHLCGPGASRILSKAIQSNTRAIFAESLGNPKLDVIDLKAISKVARDEKIPFIVDNTVATPALLNPIEHGANIVIHS